MNTEQIRQALERELGDGYEVNLDCSELIIWHKEFQVATSILSVIADDPIERAAIGRALLAAAGEDVVTIPKDAAIELYEAIAGDANLAIAHHGAFMQFADAIAALQALGGGDV